ncbi:RND family efflux transporter, MFP subunit [Neorhodopirellula lusitana]|uniref:RND family efflux transporter, MFP subunit n=1 Tax=Neorhodopirellula lusitana TaxID=445327 RepID=A0ABY1QKY5_9BACT|nr:efflux RND transporter periplasmic adaptor subunit [Neorhodopirellula lusitana]SMP72296.1 RND family efflux transporter, MFP subunit [Neorhodopirellula lusitana]
MKRVQRTDVFGQSLANINRIWIAISIVGMSVGLIGCDSGKNDYQAPPPPSVTVASPVRQAITPFMEQNGIIEAVDEADVRARVQGFVESIAFEPGKEVAAGQVLYQIEPEQYQAAVNSAQASVESSQASIEVARALVSTAEAELKRTSQNLARERAMMQKQAGSQAQLDAAIAANDAATAALKSANANVQAAIAEESKSQASLAQAKLDLGYTTVKSPIRGRISKTDVKQGNLVENGTKLTTVVNHEKMFANFSVSDREIMRLMKQKRERLLPKEELDEPDWNKMPVYLKRETDDGFSFTGVLNYVDQQGVDAATGTLGLRAQFDNSHDMLIPGLFVTVRMPLGDADEVTLVPEYAVLRDQRGQYCLVVNGEQKVERVEVSVTQTVSGWSVIESGLTLDSRVVVDGLQRARPGLEVKATAKTLEVTDFALMRGMSSEPADQPSRGDGTNPQSTDTSNGDAELSPSEVE